MLKIIQISKSGPKSGPRASNRSQLNLHITRRKSEPDIQHHRQADDLGARFKVTEWRAFCHMARLRNHPARLKLVLSDSAFYSNAQ